MKWSCAFILILLMVPPTGTTANAQGLDLTGLWQDDTGGGAVYRVRQIGSRFYWIVDGTSKGSYVNLAFGDITGNTMSGKWVDMPGSPTLGGGNLFLRIESNDRLVKVSSSSYYGAQAWTRQGSPSGGITGGGAGGGTGGGSETWQYRSDGEWTGTWTRRGTSDVFDSELHSGANRQNIVEKVTIEGRHFHSERLQSSDGLVCVLDGALDSDNRTYRGIANCQGGPSGWVWSLTMRGTGAPAYTRAASPSTTQIWRYDSSGDWNGIWTRRGTSDLFDSELYRTNGERQTILQRVTFQGDQIHIQRVQSSDGKLCTLEGTLQSDGQSYQGTAQCPGGPNGWWWRIRAMP